MKNLINILSLFLISITHLSAQTKVDDLSGLDYGEHQVGFQFLELFDLSRSPFVEQTDKKGRIAPIYLWYPTNATHSKETMSLSRYMDFWASETDYNISVDSLVISGRDNYAKSYLWSKDLSNYKRLRAAQLETKAWIDAPIGEEKYPLILLNHGPIINWQFVAEYLASHGYVVAFAPVAGTYDKRLEASASGVVTQLRDMEFIVGQLTNWPNVDTHNIGTIGFSLGSIAATGFAAKNTHIKAVISLDGVIADRNEGELIHRLPYFDAHNLTADVLHIASNAAYSTYMDWINQWQYSDRYVVQFTGLRHRDYFGDGIFQDLGIPMQGEVAGNYKEGFQWVSKYMKSFFDSGLKQDRSSLKGLMSLEDYPPSVVKQYVIKGTSKSYSFPQLIKLVFEEDFNKLFEIARNAEKGSAPFSYDTFHDVGLQMLYRKDNEPALKWFESFAEHYPKAVKPRYLMAVCHRRLQNKEEAIKAFNQAKSLFQQDRILTASQKDLYKDRIDNFVKQLSK